MSIYTECGACRGSGGGEDRALYCPVCRGKGIALAEPEPEIDEDTPDPEENDQ